MCTHTLKTVEKRTNHLEWEDETQTKIIRVEDPYNGEMETYVDSYKICPDTPHRPIRPFSEYKVKKGYVTGIRLFVGDYEPEKHDWMFAEADGPRFIDARGPMAEDGTLWVISPQDFLAKGAKFDLWGWLVVVGLFSSRSELRRNNNHEEV